jgi:predicted GNAT family acetyltransferase
VIERKYNQETSELAEAGLSSTRFLAKEGEKIVSQALVVEYRNQTAIPFGYVVYVQTQQEYRGLGLAGGVMNKVNKFLEEKGIMGVLENKINKNDPGFRLYQDRGWRESKKYENWMIYGGKQAAEAQINEVIEYLVNQKIEDEYDFEIKEIDIDRRS